MVRGHRTLEAVGSLLAYKLTFPTNKYSNSLPHDSGKLFYSQIYCRSRSAPVTPAFRMRRSTLWRRPSRSAAATNSRTDASEARSRDRIRSRAPRVSAVSPGASGIGEPTRALGGERSSVIICCRATSERSALRQPITTRAPFASINFAVS